MKFSKIAALIVACSSVFGLQAALPNFDIITSPAPTSDYGSITRMSVESKMLGDNVIVDVWVPADYNATSEKRYPVLYVHDGQNLFDSAYSFAGVPWGLDKACENLACDDNFMMPIIVGINNRGASGLRPNDYFPENALDYIPDELRELTYIFRTCNNLFLGNEEAAFVVEELKPLVDTLFMTSPGMQTTFAMGSSMGVLASLYLLCEYPEVFGGAACMSTHWIGSLNLNPDYSMNDDEVCANAIIEYLSENIPSDGAHRLYLDQGTEGWDAGYQKYEVVVREIVREKGYTEESGRLYVYDAKGAGHNEWFWQQRVKIPLEFLLSRRTIEELTGVEYWVSESPNETSDIFMYDLKGNSYAPSLSNSVHPGIYVRGGEKIMVK